MILNYSEIDTGTDTESILLRPALGERDSNPEYTIDHDEVTGDWCAASMDTGDQQWFYNRDSAVKYAMWKAGILGTKPDLDHAPERC